MSLRWCIGCVLILLSAASLACSLPVQLVRQEETLAAPIFDAATATIRPTVSTPTVPPQPTTAVMEEPAVDSTPSMTKMRIQIDPFPNGNEFVSPGPVWINGTVSKMPFEKQMMFQVLDEQGTLVQQGPVTVTGEYGSPGTFTFKITWETGQSGTFRVRVVSHSAKDGSEEGSGETLIVLK